MENSDESFEAVFVAQHFPLLLRVLQNAERMRMFAFLWEREFFGEDLHSLQHFAYEVITKTCETDVFREVVKKVKKETTGHSKFKRLRAIAKTCIVLKSLVYRLTDKPYDIYSSTDRDAYYRVIRRTCKTTQTLSNAVTSLILERTG